MNALNSIDIAMLWAASPQGLIGRDNWMPWRLSDDLRRFKALTVEGCVVMGHRTFQCLGKPLPKRDNLVMRRSATDPIPGVQVVHSLEQAAQVAKEAGHDRLWVVGGAQIYKLALPHAKYLEMTLVQDEAELLPDDTLFPFAPDRSWRLTEASRHEKDERHSHAFSFLSYEKIG